MNNKRQSVAGKKYFQTNWFNVYQITSWCTGTVSRNEGQYVLERKYSSIACLLQVKSFLQPGKHWFFHLLQLFGSKTRKEWSWCYLIWTTPVWTIVHLNYFSFHLNYFHITINILNEINKKIVQMNIKIVQMDIKQFQWTKK